MEAVTALGVASAAVAFFDCALGIFKDYSEIHRQGQILTLKVFEDTARDLINCKNNLEGYLAGVQTDDDQVCDIVLKVSPISPALTGARLSES